MLNRGSRAESEIPCWMGFPSWIRSPVLVLGTRAGSGVLCWVGCPMLDRRSYVGSEILCWVGGPVLGLGSRAGLGSLAGSCAGSGFPYCVGGHMLSRGSHAEPGVHLGILKIVSLDLLTLKT